MPDTSLHAAVKLYLDAVRRRGRSHATLDSYRRYLSAYLRFLDEARGLHEPTIADLTLDLVEQAQDWLRDRSLGRRDGAVAVQAMTLRLRMLARFLWRRGFFETDPLARLELPRVPKAHRQPFSESEVRRLVEAARIGPNPVMERALVLLALDTGARNSELCGLDVADLEMEAGAVILRRTKGGRPRRVIFRVRHLPDGGPCMTALSQWLVQRMLIGVEGQPLFVDDRRRRLTPQRLRSIFAALGRTDNVQNAIPHRFRHTHATELLAELPGAEIQLRARLGHIDPDTLRDYITVSDPMAQHVADAASLSAKWRL